jgi:hypothetical protein
MPLSDGVTAYGHSLNDFSGDRLEAQVREVAAHLAQLRAAPLIDTYTGPVLFEGQASAEIFAQAFLPKLIASRRPIADNPAFNVIFARASCLLRR